MRKDHQIQENGEIRPRDQIWFLDVLRIVSCAAVVVFHVAALWYQSGSFVPKAYHYLTEFPVPVFFMVSGVLFLDPERKVSVSSLWKKHILKLVILYFTWSFGYNIKNIYRAGFEGLGEIPSLLAEGWYHMWYLPAAIGLYILVPLIRPIVEEKSRCLYFLAVSFVLNECVPVLGWSPAFQPLQSFIGQFSITLFGSAAFYFVLGYALNSYPLERKWKKVLYPAAIALQIVVLTGIYFGAASPGFDKLKSLAILFFIAALFLYAKDSVDGQRLSPKAKAIIRQLSSLTLGIYLVHPLVMVGIDLVPFDLGRIPFILLIPAVSLAVFLVSAAVILVVKQLPVINKWLV